MSAALRYLLNTLEESWRGDNLKYYLNDQQNGVICKLRNISLDDTNNRAFDTEEEVLPLLTIQRRNYRHGVNFLVRPDTGERKELMMYL